ncbi:MAG: T9SS type A sorting domain-containing protein [Sphingobacteriales bacterium]|nr:MAG: T9SS type A sorting domain-containing protein [Sphingobacteriales bacterium]
MRAFFLLLFYFLSTFCYCQGLNNLWLLGARVFYQTPNDRAQIDFSSGSAVLSPIQFPMNIKDVAANITDKNGNLLFYTNGVWIADRTHAKMPNGDSLSPGWNTNDYIYYNNGCLLSQSVVTIPKPGDTAVYFLFHVTMEGPPIYSGQHVWMTTIDMRLRGGLGDVVSKNQVILQQDVSPTRLTAVKHANGRDWWVVAQGHQSNQYWRFLVTPDGIFGPYSQYTGSIHGVDEGGARFSPDGSRYATYTSDTEGVEVYDFDRCTGLLSSPVFIAINDSATDGGLAFSPNSDVLYVSTGLYVYQLNVAAGNAAAIAASKQKVATWDGFHDPAGPIFITGFLKSELAADGKIYISTGNSTQFLHEIHQPNNLGLACNLTQHSLQLPTYSANAIPNHPNYHVGPLIGSPCDTLVSASKPVQTINIQLYPNPNNGDFSINLAPQPKQGLLQVYDVMGKLVHTEAVAAWSQLKRLSQPGLQKGVYHCRLTWGNKSGVVRFVKE